MLVFERERYSVTHGARPCHTLVLVEMYREGDGGVEGGWWGRGGRVVGEGCLERQECRQYEPGLKGVKDADLSQRRGIMC